MNDDVHISLTRLRLASVRYLPGFLWLSWLSIRQARASEGFIALRLLSDRRLTFWTMTAWEDLAAMRAFRGAGAHRRVMPKLALWCDEASVTRWQGPLATAADWPAACERMMRVGEPSTVRRPSPAQQAKAWAAPRLDPPREVVFARKG